MFLGADAVHVLTFFFYLGDLTARFRMVLGHQLVLLVFVFLVVLQGALATIWGSSPGEFSCCTRNFCFALDSCVPLVQVGPWFMSSCRSLVCLI